VFARTIAWQKVVGVAYVYRARRFNERSFALFRRDAFFSVDNDKLFECPCWRKPNECPPEPAAFVFGVD
jgi:hypothetical protein